MEHIKNIGIGIVLGVANVIPGVSAGTMAVILNVYDKILDAVSLKKEKLKENFPFIIMLGLGGVMGILILSNAMDFLYEYYKMQTSFFFIGIIIGSIPMVWKQASNDKKLNITHMMPFVIALIIMLIMAFTQGDEGNKVVWTSLNVKNTIWIIITSMVSAFAMIIPGISGSFIMLTLGTYTTVITAISDMNIKILVPVAIGCLIGLIIGAKIVKVLLRDHRRATYLAILGLVIGSVFSLYPGFTMTIEGMVSILIMLVATYISYYFSAR